MGKQAWASKGGSGIGSKTWIFGVNGGTVWGHNPPVYHLAQSHPVHLWADCRIYQQNKEWAKAWKYPHWGLMLKYMDYRNRVLGQSVVGIVYWEPKIRNRFTYRIGTGVSYQTHPFNSEYNSTNLMLGSWIAYVMHLQIAYYQPLSHKYGLRFSWGLTHISNGAFSQPNSGMNLFYIGTGFYFNQAKSNHSSDSISQFSLKKRWNFVLSTSMALVEKFPVGGPKYPLFQIQGRVQYRLGRKSSITTGWDWKRNAAVQNYIDNDPNLGSSSQTVGLPIGHELHISTVSMITELGFYLWKKHDVFPEIYQRYGVRNYWTENCFTGVYLNTHKAKAECIEWSLGYRW
jgi:hypothetical protein